MARANQSWGLTSLSISQLCSPVSVLRERSGTPPSARAARSPRTLPRDPGLGWILTQFMKIWHRSTSEECWYAPGRAKVPSESRRRFCGAPPSQPALSRLFSLRNTLRRLPSNRTAFSGCQSSWQELTFLCSLAGCSRARLQSYSCEQRTSGTLVRVFRRQPCKQRPQVPSE